jgi:hypothetical protein
MSGPRNGPGVYIEVTIQGNFAKVTAIDGATGVEASIMGPATAPRDALAAAAARKLRYVLEKKGGA